MKEKQKSMGSFNKKPKEVMISLDIIIPKKSDSTKAK